MIRQKGACELNTWIFYSCIIALQRKESQTQISELFADREECRRWNNIIL